MLTGQLPKECQMSTTGEKGNRGKYIDQCKRICAAGLPTAQGDYYVKSTIQSYTLEDEVNALLGDAIIPPPPPKKLAPLHYPIQPDKRHASFNSEIGTLLNPPPTTKFQDIIAEMRSTPYYSFWKKPLGGGPDPVPMFPKGFDIKNTTYGKKNNVKDSLYDLIMPKTTLDNVPKSHQLSAQPDRKYCRPAYNPDLTYGYRTNVDKENNYIKCCLTDSREEQGTDGRTAMYAIQADKHLVIPTLGNPLTPNNNINCVPKDHRFGKVELPENLMECLSSSTINSKQRLFRKCLAHINTLRRVMSKRFLPSFFNKMYMALKYEDKNKTGWLPKETVYGNCDPLVIRFDSKLIEPLLCLWDAFDGSQIRYKMFTDLLNYTTPIPESPEVQDSHPDCLDFRTTYREMVKPGQPPNNHPRAGVPSGRYLDTDYPITPEGYCKADRIHMPQESNIECCLKPSIFTLMNVSHRDMYAQRDPATVRKVFEGAGEEFTDEKFNQVWEEAKKHHSQGLVCYETFRRALEKLD